MLLIKMQKSVSQEIKQQNKQHEFQGVFRMLIYRHFSVPITSLLVKTKISPNMVTTFSLILAFIAAIFYYKADYASLVIGTVILNMSLILDYVDGELARYKKLSSTFGAWWDSVCDRLTEYIIFSSLIFGLYFKTADCTVLILGFFAFANLMMISLIRNLNWFYFKTKQKQEHELRLGRKMYMAGADTFVVLVTITTLLNEIYYFLLIYLILGAIVWVRQMYKARINFKNL